MTGPYVGQQVQFNLPSALGPNSTTLGFGGISYINADTGKVNVRGFADGVPNLQWTNGCTFQVSPNPGTVQLVCWPANPVEQTS